MPISKKTQKEAISIIKAWGREHGVGEKAIGELMWRLRDIGNESFRHSMMSLHTALAEESDR